MGEKGWYGCGKPCVLVYRSTATQNPLLRAFAPPSRRVNLRGSPHLRPFSSAPTFVSCGRISSACTRVVNLYGFAAFALAFPFSQSATVYFCRCACGDRPGSSPSVRCLLPKELRLHHPPSPEAGSHSLTKEGKTRLTSIALTANERNRSHSVRIPEWCAPNRG
ncbi:hypothetical protein ZHAS_00016761 [Anopheles sinensis]|uniref:Uncharacterized protein n=1 Tax=Anopheles sinensis TaxID=74873 RepID=A0A084WEW1_ANOSI|nr:hypothetical protein ZHAS_00016761 [Anopheles sinensis]